MVKPPKSMQPESIEAAMMMSMKDNDGNERDTSPNSSSSSSRNNNNNSKKNKNPHRPGGAGSLQDTNNSFHHYMARKITMQRQQFGIENHLPPSPLAASSPPSVSVSVLALALTSTNTTTDTIPTNTTNTNTPTPTSSNKKQRKVTFQQQQHQHKQRQSSAGMTSLMERLKRKHGKRKRKRQSSTASASASATISATSSASATISATSSASASARMDQQKQQQQKQQKQQRRNHLFFRSVVILVNGYTIPDNETLQRLLHQHGGDRETYETTRVTHIIAHNLSMAKVKIYKKQKQPIPVVKPQWIVDCVKQQRLLPHGPYLIDELRQHQPLLSLFEAVASPELDNSPSCYCNWNSPEHGLPFTQTAITTSIASIPQTQPSLSSLPPPSQQQQQPHSTLNGKTDTKYIGGKLRTTGTDPNFLDSFFHNSRLSFIGSFQQRTKPLSSPLVLDAASVSAGVLAAKRNTVVDSNNSNNKQRFVFHVDMDCFFASVVLRHFPEHRDKPVVISHAGQPKHKHHKISKDGGSPPVSSNLKTSSSSSSECATCNYEARNYGIQKGMFLGRARELCPHLVVLQYDFDGYEEVSEQVTDIMYRYAGIYGGSMEQVSCDEAYMELHLVSQNNNDAASNNDAKDISERIREEIVAATECTATIGIGANKLLAKLATDKVKPNGCHVVLDFRDLLEPLNLRDLHGIGRRSERKLTAEGLVTIKDVWDLGDRAESELCRILGAATGKKIHAFCRGEDDREVKAAERKTIGVECNYGVRFDGPYGVDYMIHGLAQEVHTRMVGVGVTGSRICLKVKQRKKNAKPPPKFLGHGSCHSLSRSMDFPGGTVTNDADILARFGLQLFQELSVELDDVRGMGIIVSKLSSGSGGNTTKSIDAANRLSSWLQPKLQVDAVKEVEVEMTNRTHESQSDSFDIQEEHQYETFEDDGVIENDEVEVLSNAGETGHAASGMIDSIDDDFELPPQSQIRMSQVAALPSAFKRKIAARLEARRRQDTADDIMDNDDENMDDPHWKQTSVKDLFKLAAVKAGKENLAGALGESVSLTQLACLPFEMQLQIATNGQIGSPSGNTAATMFSPGAHLSTTTEIPSDAELSPKRLFQPPSYSKTGSSTATLSVEPDLVQVLDDNDDGDEIDEPFVPPSSFRPNDRRSFYLENVAPLKEFLNENESSNTEAVQCVVDFLTICAKEGRLQHAVTLLRSIQNRSDGWSSTSGSGAYAQILESVDESIREKTGCYLDRTWLKLSGG